MKRRTRLIVHEPNHAIGFTGWSVGYWDGTRGLAAGRPARDFRCFGTRPTRGDANALARKVAADRKGEFFYGGA